MAKAKTSKVHDLVWQHVLSCRQMKGLKFNFNQEFKKFRVDFICKEQQLIIQIDEIEAKLEKLLTKGKYRFLVLDSANILKDIDGVKAEIEAWIN